MWDTSVAVTATDEPRRRPMKWALNRQRDGRFAVAFGNLTREQAAKLLLAAQELNEGKELEFGTTANHGADQ
jgi:hypothetical protein